MCLVAATVSAAPSTARVDFTLRKMVEDIDMTFTFDDEQKIEKLVSYIHSWEEDYQAAGDYAYTVIEEYKQKLGELLPRVNASSTAQRVQTLELVRSKLGEDGIQNLDLNKALEEAQDSQSKIQSAQEMVRVD